VLKKFEEFYLSQIPVALTLSDAKDYAKAAGIEIDVKEWIQNRYMVEA